MHSLVGCIGRNGVIYGRREMLIAFHLFFFCFFKPLFCYHAYLKDDLSATFGTILKILLFFHPFPGPFSYASARDRLAKAAVVSACFFFVLYQLPFFGVQAGPTV